MKEKFDFVWQEARKAIEGVNSKRISVEQGKSVASLLKQANNILSTQLDTAKFIQQNKANAESSLLDVGLMHPNNEG